MRPPKLLRIRSGGTHAPRRMDPAWMRNVRTMGPGSLSSFLKVVLDVAWVLLGLITGALLILLVVAIFIPMTNLNITVSSGGDGRQLPLTRALLVFGVGALTAYFGGFMLILQGLRKIFRTLTAGDPFHPDNVRRLLAALLRMPLLTVGVMARIHWQALRLWLKGVPFYGKTAPQSLGGFIK